MNNDIASFIEFGRIKNHLEEDDVHHPLYIEPGISVVVCTYNRPASLKRFLRSLTRQVRRPDHLLIVDASPDTNSSEIVRDYKEYQECLSEKVTYCYVSKDLRGLTRQRNLALGYVITDLIVFFDDDVVLDINCLKELECVMRGEPDVIGVGAFIENTETKPGSKWEWMRRLRAVSDLEPGRYSRSGIANPVRFLERGEELVEVDRIPGCCMMWRTQVAQKIGFNEGFVGYSPSEDVEFSRKAAKYGRLAISPLAKVDHLKDANARPDLRAMAQMTIKNRYHIHKTTLENRNWRDVCWFIYGQMIDSLLTITGLLKRGKIIGSCAYLIGGLQGTLDLILKKQNEQVDERMNSIFSYAKRLNL